MKTVTAGELMTRDVITVGPMEPLSTVIRIFQEKPISAIPVVGKGKQLVGIITKTDLILHAHAWGPLMVPESTPTPEEEAKSKGVEWAEALARDLMSPVLVTAPPDASARAVATMMRKHDIHHVPITERGKLKGMVSTLDLIRILAGPRPA